MLINKCLFPTAGYGTRFLPLTKSMPKEMIPILNKPLIHYGVDEAYKAGIHNMAFVTGRGKRAIEDYFDYSYELEAEIHGTQNEHLLHEIHEINDHCTFSYTRQKKMRGLGDAVLSGETLIGKEPFAVVLADNLCVCPPNGVISQMIEVFTEYKCCIVAVESLPIDQIHKHGCVSGRTLKKQIIAVENIVEKPKPEVAPSNLAVIGRYILTPDIFEIIRGLSPGADGEIQLTDALKIKAERGELLAFKISGQRFDCGSVEGFVKATSYFHDNSM